jgi:hypothetical protein
MRLAQSATMSGMKTGIGLAALLGMGILVCASRAGAQAGSIEFVARATPSGGLEEPVRGFPFYLLSKSFDDIEKEVGLASPKPKLDQFISNLDKSYSAELKAWMKKNQCVHLGGEELVRKLTPTDILGVPEFRKAYMQMNSGNQSADFPKPPKVKPSDQAKNPEKAAKLFAEYEETVRRYIEQHPESVDEIYLSFTDIDPGPKWDDLVGKRQPEIRRRALELAQSKYLVARAQTDIEGQGYLRGVAPGRYWISTLDVAAVVGDAHPLWDVPVTVRPGHIEFVALSNVNAFQPPQNSE